MNRKAVDSLAIQQDFTFRGRVDAGEEVEDGGLSCTIRPDQPPDLTHFDLQVVVLYGPQSTEVVRHVMNPKDRQFIPLRPDSVSAGEGS